MHDTQPITDRNILIRIIVPIAMVILLVSVFLLLHKHSPATAPTSHANPIAPSDTPTHNPSQLNNSSYNEKLRQTPTANPR